MKYLLKFIKLNILRKRVIKYNKLFHLIKEVMSLASFGSFGSLSTEILSY